jgi:hypothetical protein
LRRAAFKSNLYYLGFDAVRHMLFDKPGDAGLVALITPRDDFGEIIDIGISEKSSTLGFSGKPSTLY